MVFFYIFSSCREILDWKLSKYKNVTQKCYTCYNFDDISKDNFWTNNNEQMKFGTNNNDTKSNV